MTFFMSLWMPILLSAVLVWIASFLMHMVFPHHKSEYRQLPDEDKFNGAMEGVSSGLYMFQFCSPENMKDPEKVARIQKGPNGILAVWPGPVNMGQNLIMTLLFYVIVGVFVAYLGKFAGLEGTEYMHRFRVIAAAALACHGLGWMPFLIWFRFAKFWPNLVDSIVYALITAGTFAWLWPKS